MGVPEMQTQPHKKGHIASYKPSGVEVRSLNDSRFVFFRPSLSTFSVFE